MFGAGAEGAAAAVGAMNEVISHRGPDGSGIYGVDEVTLGHRRLAIVDLSDAGCQPMHYLDRYVISYNGEIYNHIELRAELEMLGHSFLSHTDTEVILAAYAQWGVECLDHFNGMWAFLLYDKEERVLFVARDRFGVKPLYYWINPGGAIAFASEIKQFTVLQGWQARLNHQRTYDFLGWGVLDHTDETLFSGVFQLRGGQCALLGGESVRPPGGRLPVETWYRLPDKKSDIGYEEAVTGFRGLLADAVALRLRADVPVGSCLSGGLDSSSIVGLMHRQLARQEATAQQNTFSACAHDPRFDERAYIEEVVGQTGASAHYVYPDPDELFPMLDKMLWHQDEPFGSTSIFAQWEVFRLAQENGVTVMLDGQGADEQLAGYIPFWGALVAELLLKGRWFSAGRELRLARRISKLGWLQLAKHVVASLAPAAVQDLLRRLTGYGALVPAWLNAGVLQFRPADPVAGKREAVGGVNGLCRLQLEQMNLQMLLHWEDRDSMAHSIEARVPFLDYRLVEFLIGLPGDYKIGQGFTKRIMRDAMRGVIPESIRGRTDKLGFVTPEQVWLASHADQFRSALEDAIGAAQGIVRPEAKAMLEDMIAGRIRFSSTPWRIICFGAWMRCFKVVL